MVRTHGPICGLVFEDEGVEEGLGGAFFFGIELGEGLELEPELLIGAALGGIEEEGIARRLEGGGELPRRDGAGPGSSR